MKKNRLVSLIIIISIVVSLIPSGAFAASTPAKANGELNVKFTITERSGESVNDYFFRRGIAIEKGLLYSAENICLTENGVPIKNSIAETLETYEDGSIRWLLISANVDLKPNEFKTLTVTNGKSKAGKAIITKGVGKLNVKAEKIEATFGANGVESLKFNGEEKLKGGTINLYVTVDSKTMYLRATEFEVVKNNDSYSKFRISGKLRNDISGEMYITLANDASKIEIDHTTIAENHIDIEGTGLEIGVSGGGKVGEIITSDFLDLGSMQLATYDNTRFQGATNDVGTTGYIIGKDSVKFAPIVNGKPYTYWDGVSRTAHLYICFEGDGESFCKTLALPPNPKADNLQYEKAGEIVNAKASPLVLDFIDTVNEAYKRGNGRFEAGVLTGYNPLNDEIQIARSMPGETEYNFGIAYMQTGNEELLRQIVDMSEFRCDVLVYRGMHKDYHGIMRPNNTYSATSGTGFFQSHGYYSDEGGLYMTYVLTGDERAYKNLKLCVDMNLKYMYARTGYKGNYNCEYLFLGGPDNPEKTPSKSSFTESRGLIRARTMYLCYRLFKDVKYKQAAYDIIDMAEEAQLDDGGFTQIYMNNGTLGYQGSQAQLPRKHYVNLMGVRGISQILDFEDNAQALDIVIKQADYLCNLGDKFGPTLMDPNSDPNVYRVNEDNSRVTDNRANIMAVDVLCTAYEHTGNERYLEWILKYLEAFIASSVSGLGGRVYDIGMGRVGKWNYEIQRNVSLLRTSDNLSELFENEREKIVDMGFEHLALAFDEGAKSLGQYGEGTVNFPYATRTVYENNGTKSIMMMNAIPETATEYDESWGQDVSVMFKENRIWEGCTNLVNSPLNVTLSEYLDFKGILRGIQRPIYIEDFAGEAKINLTQYSEEKISLTFSGDFETSLRIGDGRFKIDDGNTYSVDIKKVDDLVNVTITKGGVVKPENGSLYLKFNSNGENIASIGLSLLENTSLKGLDPQTPLSKQQLTTVAKELYGCDIDFGGKEATWGNYANELVGAMTTDGGDTLSNAGLYYLAERAQNPTITDKQAVTLGAEALEIVYEGDSLSSDVFLTPVSTHNTTVKWKSNREDILSDEGILNRQNVDCDTVTLTATVTRGSESCTRQFVIPLDRDMSSKIKGFNGYDPDINMDGLQTQTGTFEISVTGTITTPGKVESIIVLGSSKAPIEAHANFNFGVRMGWNGFVDIYDGTKYRYDVEYKIKPGRYTIRMVVRLSDMTYDVYFKPEGEKEFLIAENYKNRETGIPIDEVDQIWLWEGIEGAFKVEDISLLKVKKSNPVNVFITDANGNKFSKYDSLVNYAFPVISENSKFINWQIIDTNVKMNEEFVRVHLGIEGIGQERKSAFNILQEARLIGSTIKEDDYVTPASLIRILSLK